MSSMNSCLPSPKTILPYLSLSFGILALGFSAIFVRWADAPAAVMGLYRIGLSTLILAPLFIRHWHVNGGLRLGTLLLPIVGGLVMAGDHFLFNTAISFTSAANATLLGNTAPLWVALGAWLLFRERLVRLFWLGLLLTMSGAATILGVDFLRHPLPGLGDVIALGSGLLYAGYYLITQRSRMRLDALSYVWVASLVSSLALLATSLSMQVPLTGYSPKTYLAFLGAALISQTGGYLAIAYALGHLPASLVAPTMLGQPVLTALLAIPLLGERMYPSQVAGGLVVLMGILLVHRSRATKIVPEIQSTTL